MIDNHAVKVIAVSSGKGGVGKTSVSVNLAVGLAKRSKSVMLMDADLGMANIDIMLGINPRYDLFHVITGECSLEEVIVEGPMGIKIVPAASGIGRMAELSVAEQAGLINAFDDLRCSVDVLVVDTAAGISTSVISFSKAAQEILVVVCDEPASITDAYALIKVLNQEHGVRRFQILCNMVSDAEHGKRLFAKMLRTAEIYLDVSIAYMGSIPMDGKLREAVRMQTAVLESFPYASSSIAFQRLAKKVESLPAQPPTTGYLEFFIGKNSQSEGKIMGSSR